MFFDKNTKIISDVEYFDKLTFSEKILSFTGKKPTRLESVEIKVLKNRYISLQDEYTY
jgi:hypothetical protein